MIRRNLVANFAGRLWIALMSFAFVPVYIHFIGIEAYGLLGFLLSVQGLLALLDLGLSYTINRELADTSARDKPAQADTLRTFESVYWSVGIASAAAIALTAPLLAGWLNYQSLDVAYARRAVLVFALGLAAFWPSALYSAALAGLERQVSLNVVNAVAATARGIGGALVVWLWSPTLEALLAWQALINIANTFALRLLLQPAARGGRFRREALTRTARYAMGVSGILVMMTLLAQMDKLVLTRLLTLDEFGYYSLAWTVASMLASYLASPVTATLFPRLVRAHGSGNWQELARLYHLGCQLVGLLVVPIAATLICYAEPLLLAWTRDAAIAARSAPLLQLLVAGVGLNLLVAMSYSLQAAAGWNRLAFTIQAVSIPVMAALLVPSTLRWGALGAGASWLVLYALHVIVGPYLMHRRVLGGEYRTWITADLLAPVCGGMLGVLAVRLVVPVPSSTIGIVAVSGAAWLAGAVVQSVCSARLHGHLRTLHAKHP